MKREIKFRAWCDGEMYHYIEHTTFFDGSNGCTLLCKDGGRGFSPDEGKYILMQYTGLKDKNGKEIYEGDILSDNEIIFRVYYVPGGFVIKDSVWRIDKAELTPSDELVISQLSNMQNRTYIEESCEVMGNIYENPELLNA